MLAELAALRAGDLPVTGGTTWAYIYDSGSESVRELGARAYAEMLDVNALDPTAFPSVVALENSVVGTVAPVLGGGVGTFTSGRHRVLPPRREGRQGRAVRCGRWAARAAGDRASGVPQGGALPRADRRDDAGRRGLPGAGRPAGRRDHRPD